MGEGIELTKAEQIARDHFILVFREGHGLPCDYDISAVEAGLPSWYNEVLFQRGQNYFQQNRAGVLVSNLFGIICFLAKPQWVEVLQSTGRTSTIETARKRYLSTIAHTLSWYDMDLTPGSKSFESLKKVRKLHYLSSKAAETKGIGAITQAELATTAFGFMGFALLRPHMLGIRYDNEDDRKAFVHFWAVICYMIGVHDRFNVCLLPFDAVIVFCQIAMRYVLLPIIQLETPDFKDMTQAMLKGMRPYLHTTNYEVDLFTAKQLLMVPGYQYRTDNTLEVHCRSILTQNELNECNKYISSWKGSTEKPYLSADIPIIEVTRGGEVNNSLDVDENTSVVTMDQKKENPGMTDYLRDVMKLGPSEQVNIKYINYEREWQDSLNDSKFNELSAGAKFSIRLKYLIHSLYNTTVGRYLLGSIFGVILDRIRKAADNYHATRQVQFKSVQCNSIQFIQKYFGIVHKTYSLLKYLQSKIRNIIRIDKLLEN